MQSITTERKWIAAAEAQLRGLELSREQDDAIIGLLELCVDSPNEALGVIRGVIKLRPRSDVVNYLGAGPLEDLLIKNCDLLEIVIEEASHDVLFKQCLSQVNLDRDDCANADVLSRFLENQ